jgi:hypothetical protein
MNWIQASTHPRSKCWFIWCYLYNLTLQKWGIVHDSSLESMEQPGL